MAEEETAKDISEFSFGDVVRTIWSRKLVAAIVAVVITVAGTLALFYGYNSGVNYYESSFIINFPVTAGGLIEYPDGKSRNFRDFISEENLKTIKETSEAFEDFNVLRILKSGGISISQSGDEDTSTFTIKVKEHFFPSKNVAEMFVDSIVHTVTRDLQNNIELNAESVRSGFNSSLGNERKVEFLTKQIDYFTARFNGIENMSINALAKIDSLTYSLNALKGSLHTHFYESDVEALKSFTEVRIELKRQLESAEAVLDNLLKAGASASEGGSSVIIQGADIVKYTEKVNSLTKEISYIDNYLAPYKTAENEYNIPAEITDKNNEQFDSALNYVLDGICELSTKYEAEHWLYYPAVSYAGLQIDLVYGMKLSYCIIVSLLCGIIIAAITAYIVARRSEKKRAKAAVSAEKAETPVTVTENSAKESEISRENIDTENKES